jgi:hypothetical protein
VFYIPLQDLQGIRAVFVNFPALWDGCAMVSIPPPSLTGSILWNLLLMKGSVNGFAQNPTGGWLD